MRQMNLSPRVNFKKGIRQASQQAGYESLEGIYQSPASAILNKQYSDMMYAKTRAETLRGTESNLRRTVNPDDAKVAGYARMSANDSLNKMDEQRTVNNNIASDQRAYGGTGSALNMIGEIKGLSTGLQGLYDNSQLQQAQVLSGGGFWGEIAGGTGSAFGAITAGKMYSRMFSEGDR